MSKIVTWSIVNNEISFIRDILDFHLDWVDAMYVLDTGSTDGTLEVLQEYADKEPRLFFEQYPEKFVTQYEESWHDMIAPFPEVEVRNYAILSATHYLKPDWLIQLDGDEIFLPSTRDIIERNSNFTAIGHSTINPVCKLEEHPLENRQEKTLYDPHVRIWKANREIMYIGNPAFKGHQYHCIPTYNRVHLFHHPMISFVDEPSHFHLHWMYGDKLEKFFGKQGIHSKQIMVADQEANKFSDSLPALFWKRRDEWLER